MWKCEEGDAAKFRKIWKKYMVGVCGIENFKGEEMNICGYEWELDDWNMC